MSQAPVVVVGGGFAGLAAATALAEAGVPVHLFEARPTLGGRANTFRDPVTGERIDNGQHLIAGCYTETLKFLKRVGSAACLHRPATLRVAMIDERRRRTELSLPPLPPPVDVLAGVLAWDALDWSDRWSMLRIGPALRGGGSVVPGETVQAVVGEAPSVTPFVPLVLGTAGAGRTQPTDRGGLRGDVRGGDVANVRP